MVNPCRYGGPLCMMSVRDISFFIMSPVMLFIWLTICNKKGTVRDLCTIPLSSIIYYTTMKKISTTTYYHPILWHRIRCTSRHTHTLYMLACQLPMPVWSLHRDEFFLLLHFLHYIPKCNHHLFDDQPTLPLY